MDKTASLAALSALAQETRLEAFRLLMQSEPEGLVAGEIAERLGVLQNTLSSNLAVLERAGLIRGTREGRSIRYRAELEGMRKLLAFLMEDCCGSRPELCRALLDELVCTC
ncbi:transcriptional regulator, ArsR family [Tistlia consotensis]|uniref:Transcriptional regulator, ArsR family n=1 Tax=Tistlia consotensis USBA 355 TaxID=560819 RepID=A0A1Y6CAE5_9PROT|nr:metalloregulator ArsR/SmtB family transcription factor [Tistlia consotensis]SMF54336.1 transcriptional regulator, ArsR family [Tistlia consotensis USBA 355]SNR86810.1 transcriptional regulator, ArsR family [Tistlia consotensis]